MALSEQAVRWLMTPTAPDPQTIADLLRRPAWHARAACRGHGADAFFPGRGGSMRAAKALCDVCPVRQECLAAAVADPDLEGIWGGTSPRERGRLRSPGLREAS